MRAFRLAYDGRQFHGFQRQPDVRTIEGTLFEALHALDVCTTTPSGYTAASRTDTGVSAVEQTVAFKCPSWCSPRALNAELPQSIRAWASADVPDDFHATHHTHEREYTYHLWAPDVTIETAQMAADRLSGEHDFHNVTPDDDGTVRNIDVSIERDNQFLVTTVRSNGFPRQFVRRLVTIITRISTGTHSISWIDTVLSPTVLPDSAGIPPAPPTPLVLTGVAYEEPFKLADCVEDVRDVFQDQWITHTIRARVAHTLSTRI